MAGPHRIGFAATNHPGTKNVLEAARDAGVRRVVITSSTAAVSLGHHADDDNYLYAYKLH